MPSDMTRLQIVTEVCDAVGKSVAASSVSGATLQSRVTTYFDWAQKRIARYYSFHELTTYTEAATFTSGVKRYTFTTLGLTRPKDIGSIILLDTYNSRRLVRWNRVKFEKKVPRPENFANQRPRIYTRVGNAIEVFYIPDATYSVRIVYPQWPTTLSTDGSFSDFENKDQLLVAATILETYLALEEYADANVWLPKVMGLLNDAVKAEGDVDWEPMAEPINTLGGGSMSGSPWTEAGGTPDDPLYGYPEA